MLLITSASYIQSELAAELGALPSAFLPVGNKRLIQHILDECGHWDDRICLSLPEGFDISDFDREALQAHGVELIFISPDISLGDSLLYCLNATLPHEAPLRILHGDTLIKGVDHTRLDVFSIGTTSEFYCWAEYRKQKDDTLGFIAGLPNGGFNREVLSGYFNFSDPNGFMCALAKSRGNFIESLNLYASQAQLTPLKTGTWFDFGHLQTYYRSKANMTTQRSFNSLTISERTVEKSSDTRTKIEAEAAWYETLPRSLSPFVPQYLGQRYDGERSSYATEYLYLSTLSELYVFGKLPVFIWESIFASCNEFMQTCADVDSPSSYIPKNDILSQLYLTKTLERLEQLARTRNINLTRPWTINGRRVPGLLDMAHETALRIPAAEDTDIRPMHGDLCFSNILYDFRHQKVRVIDPRGILPSGETTIYGDMRYDMAKLHHSVVGLYDYIKSDYFRCTNHGGHDVTLELPHNGTRSEIADIFMRTDFAGRTMDSASAPAISVLLFLSMSPLHADRPDHQNALLANAMRLWLMMEDADNQRSLPVAI